MRVVLADRNWQAEQKLSREQQEIGKKRLELAAVLQYTLPGVPSLYYGDEVGTEGFGDPFCRSFFDWENVDKELTEFYKKLGNFRRSNSVFKDGEFIPLHFENGCVTYLRKRDKDFVLVGVNLKSEEKEIEIPEKLSKEKIKISPMDFCLFSGKIK